VRGTGSVPGKSWSFYTLTWLPSQEYFIEFCRLESYNTYVRTHGFQRHETEIYYYIHRTMHLRQKREYNIYILKGFRIIFTDVTEPVIKNDSQTSKFNSVKYFTWFTERQCFCTLHIHVCIACIHIYIHIYMCVCVCVCVYTHTFVSVTHLLITKYTLKLAGICGFCNVNVCT